MKLQREAVLVVEDESLIRMCIATELADAGFEVFEARDADAAIAILETNLNIRLVFTDIDMPGSMDGLMLAAAVRNRWPPVKIIVTSGHVAMNDADMPDGQRFFAKPYDGSLVAGAIREMIARPI